MFKIIEGVFFFFGFKFIFLFNSYLGKIEVNSYFFEFILVYILKLNYSFKKVFKFYLIESFGLK